MKKATKILSMLVCILFVATALPTVSATPTAMSTEASTDSSYVFTSYNYTAADAAVIFGLDLGKTDSLYIWYYNAGNVLTATGAIGAYQDSNDILWFDVNITTNATNCHAFFNDADITDLADVATTATEALYVNAPFDKKDQMFIVTIPAGVSFEYNKNFYSYDSSDIAVVDKDGNDLTNISSFEYNADVGVYAMNVSDDATDHQIVIVDTTVHGTGATAVTAKYVDSATEKPWYLGGKYLSAKTTYSMTQEACTGYSVFSGEKVAFDVKKDSGLISKYIGGKTEFLMSADSVKYQSTPWYKFWGTDWSVMSEKAADVDGIKVGVIEHIYLSEKTGEHKTNEVLRANWGVIASSGVAESSSGLEILTKGTTKTPVATLHTGTVVF